MFIFLIYVLVFNPSSLKRPGSVGMCLCFRETYPHISMALIRVQMCVSLSRFSCAGTRYYQGVITFKRLPLLSFTSKAVYKSTSRLALG